MLHKINFELYRRNNRIEYPWKLITMFLECGDSSDISTNYREVEIMPGADIAGCNYFNLWTIWRCKALIKRIINF